jgi:DNA mismatch repair protein MutL
VVRPAPCNRGTLVEVRDLFFATPARLKFMKGDRAEASAVSDVVKRVAIAFPTVRFTVSGRIARRSICRSSENDAGRLARLAQVMGADFPRNALPLDAMREGVSLTGYVSTPAFTRANALQQYAYVNGRPVRDRLLAGAIRGAYADVLPRDRHPVAALFLALDPALVDVNVHPAKADVRFRDPGLVRGLIIGAIRRLAGAFGLLRMRPTPWQAHSAPVERLMAIPAQPTDIETTCPAFAPPTGKPVSTRHSDHWTNRFMPAFTSVHRPNSP